ncbi:hypothetical protein [Persicimonas caeni]|uniref:hypothetical protein n=1 Tax=Persicimonas caeni TaxID=2292766 RepID=UPI00143D61DB|nr:hypothetical protein [Persicimonas caeni]
MNKIPVPPHLSGPQASMLIELVDWLVDALIEWQQALRRTYHPWEIEADQDWHDDIPF